MGGALAKCISPNAKPQRRVQIDRKPSLDQQFDNMPPPHEWDPATNPPPHRPPPPNRFVVDAMLGAAAAVVAAAAVLLAGGEAASDATAARAFAAAAGAAVGPPLAAAGGPPSPRTLFAVTAASAFVMLLLQSAFARLLHSPAPAPPPPPPSQSPRPRLSRRPSLASLPPAAAGGRGKRRMTVVDALAVEARVATDPSGLARSLVAQASRQVAASSADATEAAIAATPNPNRPSQYTWLQPLLAAIAAGDPPHVADTATGAAGAPLFVVAGACPSVFAGMQAVVYSAMRPARGGPPMGVQDPRWAAAAVDFWWVKPSAVDPNALERSTLDRHSSGPHKNDPGRSRAVYGPFAALFRADNAGDELRFGLEPTAGGVRAYLRDARAGKRYLVLVWQEAWTANPFASRKFIRGKLLYQKAPGARALFACPYAIEDEKISVAIGHEESVDAPDGLPPDLWKVGYDV